MFLSNDSSLFDSNLKKESDFIWLILLTCLYLYHLIIINN